MPIPEESMSLRTRTIGSMLRIGRYTTDRKIPTGEDYGKQNHILVGLV